MSETSRPRVHSAKSLRPEVDTHRGAPRRSESPPPAAASAARPCYDVLRAAGPGRRGACCRPPDPKHRAATRDAGPRSADRAAAYVSARFCDPLLSPAIGEQQAPPLLADSCTHDRAIGAGVVRFGAERGEPSVPILATHAPGAAAEFADALAGVPVAPRSSVWPQLRRRRFGLEVVPFIHLLVVIAHARGRRTSSPAGDDRLAIHFTTTIVSADGRRRVRLWVASVDQCGGVALY
jgi:hypothetical protein